jgi:hypothetical protein
MTNSANPYAPPTADEVFAVEDHSFKAAGALATALCWMLGISLVVTVLSIASMIGQVELIGRMQGGGAWTMPEAEANDARVALLAGVSFLLLLATGIVWFVWQSRTSKNARALGAEFMQFGPHAWGWFFCPIINLWRPLQVLSELWRATSPDDGRAAQDRGDFAPLTAPSWFLAWWLPWLAAGVLSQIAARLATNTDWLILSSQFNVASSVMVLVSGVFAIRMVAVISQRERARAAARGARG